MGILVAALAFAATAASKAPPFVRADPARHAAPT